MTKSILAFLFCFILGVYVGAKSSLSRETLKKSEASFNPGSLFTTQKTDSNTSFDVCSKIFKEQSFDELFKIIEKDLKGELSDQKELVSLAYMRMNEILPSLKEEDFLKLYSLKPDYMFLNAKLLNTKQKEFLENTFLDKLLGEKKPEEHYEEITPYLLYLSPLSEGFLERLIKSKKLRDAQIYGVLSGELNSWGKEKRDFKPLIDIIIAHTFGVERDSLLSNYIQSLTDEAPKKALDALLDFRKRKIIEDPVGNQFAFMLNSIAYKSPDDAIEFFNTNYELFSSFENEIAENIAFPLVDQHLDEILRYIEKFNSEKAQLAAAKSAYTSILHFKKPGAKETFLEQLSKNPKLLNHVLAEAKRRDVANDRTANSPNED